MDAAQFRKELTKLMPGYAWTVHKLRNPEGYWRATGTQSAGSNRLSTMEVEWRKVGDDTAIYRVKSSGYGRRAPWLHECFDVTLAKAFHGLQEYYEAMAMKYSNHANALRVGRKPKGEA